MWGIAQYNPFLRFLFMVYLLALSVYGSDDWMIVNDKVEGYERTEELVA
jgi:hypothetical protein